MIDIDIVEEPVTLADSTAGTTAAEGQAIIEEPIIIERHGVRISNREDQIPKEKIDEDSSDLIVKLWLAKKKKRYRWSHDRGYCILKVKVIKMDEKMRYKGDLTTSPQDYPCSGVKISSSYGSMRSLTSYRLMLANEIRAKDKVLLQSTYWSAETAADFYVTFKRLIEDIGGTVVGHHVTLKRKKKTTERMATVKSNHIFGSFRSDLLNKLGKSP